MMRGDVCSDMDGWPCRPSTQNPSTIFVYSSAYLVNAIGLRSGRGWHQGRAQRECGIPYPSSCLDRQILLVVAPAKPEIWIAACLKHVKDFMRGIVFG
jgi:hypothetical protein